MSHHNPKRILLVDDNTSIHDDFRKVLCDKGESQVIDSIKNELFGNAAIASDADSMHFEIDSAYQGQDALELVKKAKAEDKPYALAIVDIRMPPGWDGIVTIQKIWEVDPDIQIVICTAFSDYSWDEISQKLKNSDGFLILKKPFDVLEIRQLAASLTKKWLLDKEVHYQIENLQSLVEERTQDLDTLYSLTKATLESTQEGILAINEEGMVTSYNQRLLSLWHLSEDTLKNQHADSIFKELAAHLDDPVLFLKMMGSLRNHTKPENIRTWQTNDGKIYEIYTQSQYLNQKIVGTVFSFRDITLQKKLEDQLLFQATHDSLTGLPNRILLSDRIQQYLISANNNHTSIALLLIDLDNFKQVNDTLGHNAGDLFLQNVANKLQLLATENDTITRFGGDEFVFVMTGEITEESVANKATHILQALFGTFESNGLQIVTSASIGISLYPKDGNEFDTLLKNADTALYFSKEAGKNSMQFFMKEFNEKMVQRMELAAALRHALDRHEFFLEYQPLNDLKSNQIIGLEALLRWNHPTLGTLLPEAFVPIAENTGMMAVIGEWMLKTACAQMKYWQRDLPHLKLALAISEKQFKQAKFIESVKQILTDTQFDPKKLELEITENLMLQNQETLTAKMYALKELGIHLTMDNFWSGYSCLMRMKNLPFNSLKMGKHFIDNLILDENDACIVDAIINMMNKMGISVLAEGVEKKEQVEFLRKNHAEHLRGYYFSAPLNQEACSAFLNELNEKA